MRNNKKTYTLLDGSTVEDLTDWKRLAAKTDEEINAAACADPDAQPRTDEELRRFRRLPEVPGGNFLDRLRARENKKPVTLRCDADVLEFYRSQGKGYQRLMNSVLRAYMESQRPASRA